MSADPSSSTKRPTSPPEKEPSSKKQKLMDFGEKCENCCDGVLVLGNHKFYVNKQTLASVSPFFYQKFVTEAPNSEIHLDSDIRGEHVQDFLAAIQGGLFLNDATVCGMMTLAKKWDIKELMDRCVAYLMEESQEAADMKLHYALEFDLEALKTKILAPINTISDLDAILPKHNNDGVGLKPELKKLYFTKAMELVRKDLADEINAAGPMNPIPFENICNAAQLVASVSDVSILDNEALKILLPVALDILREKDYKMRVRGLLR